MIRQSNGAIEFKLSSAVRMFIELKEAVWILRIKTLTVNRKFSPCP
jgi:hypothetical protein